MDVRVVGMTLILLETLLVFANIGQEQDTPREGVCMYPILGVIFWQLKLKVSSFNCQQTTPRVFHL